MWDGVIIDYAFNLNRLDGLEVWFYESGWHLQYWFLKGQFAIANFFGINYQLINYIFLGSGFLLLIREILLIAIAIKLKPIWQIFVAFYIATFPVWSIFLSSVMTFHLLCFATGILSIRLIHNVRLDKIALGWLLLIISLNLKSLIILLPILSLQYDFLSKQNHISNYLKILSRKTIIVFILCLIFIATYSTLLPAHGQYEGYNKIILGEPGALEVIYMGALSYFIFLRPIPYIFFSGLIAFLIFRKFKILSSPSTNDLIQIFILTLLIFAAILPYLAVGKSVDIMSWSDWSGRQAMLIVLPSALLVGYIFQLIIQPLRLSEFLKNLFASAVILALSLTNGIGLIQGVSEKLTRQIFEKNLEKLLIEKVQTPPSGIVQISVEGLPLPSFRVYESNYLLFRVYGRSDWWANISEKYQANFSVPKYIKDRSEYQTKYIHNYVPKPYLCSTKIELKAIGYLGLENQIKLILNIENYKGEIRLIDINVDCKNALSGTVDYYRLNS